ncbi:DMT family transporter [Acetobacter sp. DsW_059]|uniref:EamA family transporter n=1 Tax=Acetobacter sp. DsW_059 TaxID=1670661 RepID=UPI000A39C446|nr:EamA family transporter [Acetobacter sp. DsW_059]OUJ09635.1 transporter [Acetobacter sp. DsW_059]
MSTDHKQTTTKERTTAVMQLLGGMISLQFGSSAAKTMFPIFGATGMVGLRACFAAVILVIFFRSWTILSWKTLRMAMPYGLVTALMNVFFYLALQRIPLGMTVAIEFTGPLFLAFLHSQRLADVGWLLLTVTGLVLLLRPSHTTSPDTLGVLFALGAATCWAFYVVFGKRLIGKMAPGHACALGQLCGGISLFFPCFVPALITGSSHPSLLALGFIVALCSSAIPYALEMRAMHTLSARELGIFYSLEPVCAVLAGVLILHEHLELLRFCGILLVAAASAGTVIMPEKKDRPASSSHT